MITVDYWEKQGLNTQQDWFKRDTLVNDYLLGGKTIYSQASFHNPELIETDVIQFYRDVFKPSGKRCALVIGTVGNGKTYGTQAYFTQQVFAAIQQDRVTGSNGVVIKAYTLAEMVHNVKKQEAELARLRRTKYLFIDDLGTEPPGFKGQDFLAHFENLFDHRYINELSTFITSNATAEQLVERYGERFVSRVYDCALVKETVEPDLRRVKRGSHES